MSSAATAPPPAARADQPATTADGPPRPRQRSCLAKGIVSFIDGGMFGGAIGGIIASAQAISALSAGSDTIVSAVQHVVRSGFRSALSLGVALAGYSGGVCSLEKARGRRDMVNPFLVGGLMGAVGSVQRVEFHDGQHKKRALSFNPRAMMGGAFSSAALCSLFWWMQNPSRQRREEQEAAAGGGGAPGSMAQQPLVAPDGSIVRSPVLVQRPALAFEPQEQIATGVMETPAEVPAFMPSPPSESAEPDFSAPGFVDELPPPRQDAPADQLQDPWAK